MCYPPLGYIYYIQFNEVRLGVGCRTTQIPKLNTLIKTEILLKDIFEVVFRNSMVDNKQLRSLSK